MGGERICLRKLGSGRRRARGFPRLERTDATAVTLCRSPLSGGERGTKESPLYSLRMIVGKENSPHGRGGVAAQPQPGGRGRGKTKSPQAKANRKPFIEEIFPLATESLGAERGISMGEKEDIKRQSGEPSDWTDKADLEKHKKEEKIECSRKRRSRTVAIGGLA